MVFGSAAPHFGVGTRTKTPRELAAHVELDIGVTHEQGLSIRVDGNELDAAKPQLDHAVDGVNAAATDADDLNHGEIVLVRGHIEAFRSTFTFR